MDDVGGEMLAAVRDVNERIDVLLRQLDFTSLPWAALDDLNSCDNIPSGIACLYFLCHPTYGVLYIGKAKDLRRRWLPWGERAFRTGAKHQYHQRCIEIRDVRLSWLPLDELAHEIVETVAIRRFDPPWNIRKTKHGYETPIAVPSRDSPQIDTMSAEIPESCMVKLL